MGLRQIFRNEGKAQPVERGVKHRDDIIKNHLSTDLHLYVAAVLFELPSIKSACRGQSQIDTLVTGQFARMLGY